MKQYLKSYRVVLRTVGPVFVGSGREIGKKEYVFLNRGLVGIPDIQRLYGELAKRKKEAAFEDYLLENRSMDLTLWLKKQKIGTDEVCPFLKYTLDCGDAVMEKGVGRLQVLECIKDAYGKPYLPGSSLKGMFRTVLLGADIGKHPEKYQRERKGLKRNADTGTSRVNYLKRDICGVENTAYRLLNREGTKPGDAVNDLLQGLAVSDSEPLSVDDLVLCQKVDLHTNGTERRLPILRECIKPGTEIRFTLTVDTGICKLSGTLLMEAVRAFMESYYRNFAAAFASAEKPKANYVLCGGGCGFVSKTVIYPLYGRQEGIRLTQKIFEKTRVPKVHKHDRDREYGASPHTMKCTKYQGKTLQMGMCRIESIKAY